MLKVDSKNAFNSVLHAYSGPSRWKKNEWLVAGGIAVGTFGLYLLDEPLNPVFIRQQRHIPQLIQDFGTRFGKPRYNYSFTLGVYALGLITKNEEIRKTGVLLIASATAAGLIQTLSKNGVGRARPDAGEGNSSFRFFSRNPSYHSFPSGHTILGFTTTYALARCIKNPWIKAGIYAVGVITPMSRLWNNAHWASDVGLSVAISVVCVDGIFNYLTRTNDYKRKEAKISWKLKFDPGGVRLIANI